MTSRLLASLCLFVLIFLASSTERSANMEEVRVKGENLALLLQKSNEFQAIFFELLDNVEETDGVFGHKRSLFHVLEKVRAAAGDAVCDVCKGWMEAARGITESELVYDVLDSVIVEYCKVKGLAKPALCKQAIHTFGKLIVDVAAKKIFNPERACGHLRLCKKTWEREFLMDYVTEVLKDKPTTPTPTPTKRSTYKMMHISDLHVDFQYAAGTNGYCGDIVCCRNESGPAPNASSAAGYWGAMTGTCDVPMRTVDQLLHYVASHFDIDMLLWTGDNIAHDIFNQSAATQTYSTLEITQAVQQIMPTEHVYPIQGNHEAFPVNEMDYIDNTSYWLTQQLSDIWKGWLNQDEDTGAYETLREYGFYAKLNEQHNVRVIAIDTNACNNLNFFLFENPTDPYGQLAYIREQLYIAEQNQESVFIIGHIPPGNSGCDSSWSARYKALVDRFSHLIRGQFFGHTHNDHFEVARSYADNSPVGVVLVTPSVTTRSHQYPSFRIYEVDTDTNVLVNYQQYHLNLAKWNSNTTGPLQFDLFYDFLSEWNVTDMSPQTFDNLVEQFMENPKLMSTYAWNKGTGYGNKEILSTSSTWHYYCETKEAVYADVVDCLGEWATKSDHHDLFQQEEPGPWYQEKK